MANGWPSSSLWSDEAGLVIGGYGMSEESSLRFLALLNRFWDGRIFRRRRATAKSFEVRGRRLTVNLMGQPIVMARLLSASGGAGRGTGFLARFLLAQPESTMGTRLYLPGDLSGHELNAFDDRITELLTQELPTDGSPEMALTPTPLHFTQEARAEWIKLHDGVERQLGKLGDYAGVADFAAKTADHAARIAAIFHVVEHGPGGQINKECVDAGNALAFWHLWEARRLLSAMDVPEHVYAASALLEWATKQGDEPFEHSYLTQHCPNFLRGHRGRVAREAAINLLLGTSNFLSVPRESVTRNRVHPNHLVGGAE